MESQPQNPDFRINPENFHPCVHTAGQPSQQSYQGLLFSSQGVSDLF